MIKNIIFGGGGLKGWAYIGVLRALDEYISRKNIEEVIGVSIGSLFALFYVLDLKWDYLLDFFMKLDLKKLLDVDINNIIINQSLFEGKKYKATIIEIVKHVIEPDTTFKELYNKTGITYTVNATNLNDYKLQYFNHKLTPDIKVIDGIIASSSLPILFPPYCINNVFYYDGGFCNNCPVDMVDELFTIAFDLATFKKSNNISSFKLLDLLMCLATMNNKKVSVFENIYSILDIKFKDEFMNLNQSRDDIFNIYMNGYSNAKDILFKNHVALK
jgi:predicted acylesterase/phospholipase RssA